MDFKVFLYNQISKGFPVFFDGGMGTMIQTYGNTPFNIPEELNFTDSSLISRIHKEYLNAGSDVITTNTFGASSIKLEGTNLSTEKTIEQAVKIARSAVNEFLSANTKTVTQKFVALDIGPTGKLLEPSGSLSFDNAYESFKSAAIAGEQAGADLVIIETMSDLYEVKAAILAVKENTHLPIIASVTFQDNLHTLSGANVETTCTYLEGLGVTAIGLNCGVNLENAEKIATLFVQNTSLPVIMQPNAGLPVLVDGRTTFLVSPEDFAAAQLRNFNAGVSILGGCCGTTPKHIAATYDLLTKSSPRLISASTTLEINSLKTRTSICSGSINTIIGGEASPVIIGERINPTGKKKCKEALLSGDMQFILNEAESQISAGANILDVNVGLPGINEEETMQQVVRTLQKTFTIPLQIDSSEPIVLEKAMRYYNGKPLVNSVNGKQAVMDAVFPLVKKYGGCIVALCLDEDGIPQTAEGRLKIADKIISEAAKYGIKKNNIVIDMLTLTVSSQQKEAAETIRGIQRIKSETKYAGVKTVLGVSNISFGLPRRDIINSYFFSMALSAGLDACIINPLSQQMLDAFFAYKAIYGYDENCMNFISKYAGSTAPTNVTTTEKKSPTVQQEIKEDKNAPLDDINTLKSYIIKGYTSRSSQITEQLLTHLEPMNIVSDCIVPALDEVGKDYSEGRKFLPQLLLSAETVSNAFAVIKQHIIKTGIKQEVKGRIIMATVQGDIHDIGKNIVCAMLENYGYEVIDLGKDVTPEMIISTALKENITFIGLSALMTTTVLSMEKTIQMLRQTEKDQTALGNPIHFAIAVGGAVLTPEYAKKIGADYYGKDALETVAAAKEYFTK